MKEKLEKKLAHYMRKAVSAYRMIAPGDRLLVCLSGGKDSYTLLYLLNKYVKRARQSFILQAYTLDQSQPGWDDSAMRGWLETEQIPYVIETRDTYSVVKEKTPDGKTYCSLCSRLRRGNIYRYAEDNGFNKVVLGHHRDDLNETLLMSILYAGQIKSMPPKLVTDSRALTVIRPLVYCQEADIRAFAQCMRYPIIPCNLCGSQTNLKRVKVKRLLRELAADNPKVPSNILHALQSIQPSQLMDKKWWDFDQLSPAAQEILEEDANEVLV